MIWSEEHEFMLCREIVLHEMCQHKDGSCERGQSLDSIVVSLNSVTTIWFKIDQRAFSDNIKKLLQLYSTKRNKKECSFGVGPEDTERFSAKRRWVKTSQRGAGIEKIKKDTVLPTKSSFDDSFRHAGW